MKAFRQKFGLRVRELRLEKNFTQEHLADILNTEQRNISNVECGNTFPSKRLPEYAKALDVTLPELFDFEHLSLDNEHKKEYIIKNLDNISDKELTMLYRIIKSLR